MRSTHRARPSSTTRSTAESPAHCIISPSRRESRAEVDGLHEELKAIGAEIVGGPKLWPEHGPDYYAVFFKDLEGIKYEIVHSSEPH